jgi:hypothetical protein
MLAAEAMEADTVQAEEAAALRLILLAILARAEMAQEATHSSSLTPNHATYRHY